MTVINVNSCHRLPYEYFIRNENIKRKTYLQKRHLQNISKKYAKHNSVNIISLIFYYECDTHVVIDAISDCHFRFKSIH